jgi:hypothetical protein
MRQDLPPRAVSMAEEAQGEEYVQVEEILDSRRRGRRMEYLVTQHQGSSVSRPLRAIRLALLTYYYSVYSPYVLDSLLEFYAMNLAALLRRLNSDVRDDSFNRFDRRWFKRIRSVCLAEEWYLYGSALSDGNVRSI